MKTEKKQFNVDEAITEKIIANLQGGVIPWRKPWSGDDMMPRNLHTGQEYTGTNIYMLWGSSMQNNFESPYWVTFRQAQELGGHVKAGEHGSQIVRWLSREGTSKKADDKPDAGADAKAGEKSDAQRFFYPKAYTVFNVQQCEGLQVPETKKQDFSPVKAAEAIVEAYKDRPEIKHGATQAAYNPVHDQIVMPHRDRFVSPEAYYGTLFHEMAHSTGHPSRLNRPDGMEGTFGSEKYAAEELRAELCAAVLSGRCGISSEKTEQNSVAYCQNWVKRLTEDPKLFRQLANDGIKASRYIAGDNAPKQEVAAANEVAPELKKEVEATKPTADCWSVPNFNHNANDGWALPTVPSSDVQPDLFGQPAATGAGRSLSV